VLRPAQGVAEASGDVDPTSALLAAELALVVLSRVALSPELWVLVLLDVESCVEPSVALLAAPPEVVDGAEDDVLGEGAGVGAVLRLVPPVPPVVERLPVGPLLPAEPVVADGWGSPLGPEELEA
jgi:hypothetical protein